jgi:hypothetical protein
MKIEDGVASDRMQKAIQILSMYDHNVRVLGSY